MKQFSDLTSDEKEVIRTKAKDYYEVHQDHVIDIFQLHTSQDGIAPSGSDLFHPELWKGIHWRWFANEYINIPVIKPKVEKNVKHQIILGFDDEFFFAKPVFTKYPKFKGYEITILWLWFSIRFEGSWRGVRK